MAGQPQTPSSTREDLWNFAQVVYRHYPGGPHPGKGARGLGTGKGFDCHLPCSKLCLPSGYKPSVVLFQPLVSLWINSL